MSVGPYFSWKRHLIALMRERGFTVDDELPRLTIEEVARMERYWNWGYSPEEFLDTLPLPKLVS